MPNFDAGTSIWDTCSLGSSISGLKHQPNCDYWTLKSLVIIAFPTAVEVDIKICHVSDEHCVFAKYQLDLLLFCDYFVFASLGEGSIVSTELSVCLRALVTEYVLTSLLP